MRKHILIIFEAGVNHDGSMELAKKLIHAAIDTDKGNTQKILFKAYA